jgi:hypothetical protein
MLPEFTVPLTAIVPAPSPVPPFPKLMLSPVSVVIEFPLTTADPLLLVDQPDVRVPAVGEAHVPLAAP